jgi:hypothetical protein
MGKISFNELDNQPYRNNGTQRDFPVKFFSLKDGEDAIVRILIDSDEDFDVRTVHSVKVEGSQYGKNVNCIMTNGDARTCPLCSKGEKLIQKLYIKMLRYATGPDGKVTITPVIWERSRFDKNFGTQALKNYRKDYPCLSDVICRITRSGEGLNTTYTATFGLNIMPNSKAIYRDDIYVKDTSLFGDFDVLGTTIMDKTYEELETFIERGSFPPRNNAEGAIPKNEYVPNEVAPSFTNTTNQYSQSSTSYSYQQPTQQPVQSMPWDTDGQQVSRPRRYQ